MSGFGSFRPACQPLLRGGLPHTNPATAARLIYQYLPQTPAWPLPAQRTLAETPFALAAQGLPGFQIDLERDRLTVERATLERDAARVGLAYLRGDTQIAALTGPVVSALTELLRRFNTEEHHPMLLKHETIGPVSLSLALTDDHDRPLAYEAEWREVLLDLCSLRVAWQHQQVQGYATHRLAMIDEPFLDALATPICPLTWDDGLELLTRLFETLPEQCGLFLSGTVQWESILKLPVSVIGFHLTEHLQPLLAVAASLREFLAADGCLVWGVTPVETHLLAQTTAADLRNEVLAAMQQMAIATGVELAVIQQQSFISFTGSLIYLNPTQAEQALQLCAETAQSVRQIIGLSD
ncbi:hypothetical protein [Chloroflexus sp.]|uniref:hypothetical protein n=1 Tax=Chloroflexus sp. TaxID=1904827 RepID=UPI002625FD4D|nr:hypothetical protein [uncultured Chloroflexus sp.]